MQRLGVIAPKPIDDLGTADTRCRGVAVLLVEGDGGLDHPGQRRQLLAVRRVILELFGIGGLEPQGPVDVPEGDEVPRREAIEPAVGTLEGDRSVPRHVVAVVAVPHDNRAALGPRESLIGQHQPGIQIGAELEHRALQLGRAHLVGEDQISANVGTWPSVSSSKTQTSRSVTRSRCMSSAGTIIPCLARA